MLKEGKFGVHEAVCMATIAICNKIFFTTPGFLTRTVGTAAWYMTLISCITATVCFTFIYLLLKRFPGKNIVEIYDASLGRVIGFVFSFILMGTFLSYTGLYTREFVDVIKVYNFPITPPSVLIGAVVIVAAVSVFLGLETIVRTAKLAAYFALFGFLLLLVLSSQYFKLAHILPVLGYGIGKTVTTGVMRSTAYAEVTVLAVFAGSLQGIKHIKKAGYISLLLSGFLLSFGLLAYSLIFEYTSTVEITAPIYVVATLLDYGRFFERLDPIFLFVWIISTVIYLSILFYTTVSIFCKLFRIQDRRPLIIPMAVLAFAIAIFPKDFPSVVTEYIQGIRILGNIPVFILPIIALIVAVLRKKKGGKEIDNGQWTINKILRRCRYTIKKMCCLVLLLCFICVVLTACWDAKEIDNWTYAYSIGVDKGVDNVLRFTFQLPALKKESGGGGGNSSGSGNQAGGQKDYEAISIDAPTFYTGVNMVETSLSRSLNYMHTKYLVISEDLAREGVERFINGMIRSRQMRRIMYIIIVKGKAHEFIENFDPKLTGAFAKAQEGFLVSSYEDTGYIVSTSYHNFISDLKTTYRMPVAPTVAMNDFSNFKESGAQPPKEEFVAGGKYKAGELPRKGGNNFEFMGTALFDGDKMVGELNGTQTRMLLMVRGEFVRGAISMKDPMDEKLRISIDTKQQKKPDIKVEFREGKPVISVKVFLEGDLQNIQNTHVEYESVKMKPVLENAFKKDIKGYLADTINICKNLNVDTFGFGEKAVMHFWTIQEWEKYNWLSHFKDAEINTEVEFTVRRTGTLLKTNPSKDSKGDKK